MQTNSRDSIRNVLSMPVEEEKVMNKKNKTVSKRAVRRDLFNELAEGLIALAEARQGKRTLRTQLAERKSDR